MARELMESLQALLPIGAHRVAGVAGAEWVAATWGRHRQWGVAGANGVV